MNILMTLWASEGGQDLIEYSLLVAFVIMASAAMMLANGGGVEGILFTTTTHLNAANKSGWAR